MLEYYTVPPEHRIVKKEIETRDKQISTEIDVEHEHHGWDIFYRNPEEINRKFGNIRGAAIAETFRRVLMYLRDLQ